MKIYFAGAITGNLSAFWRNISLELKMGGGKPFEIIKGEALKIFLAGANYHAFCLQNYLEKASNNLCPYTLESFFYMKDDLKRLIPFMSDFLLDSGAFTFMTQDKNVNFDEYLERYADFIKANDIHKFFELDIDSVVGYEKVKKYRLRLEELTERPCIPVWHRSRGIDEFYRMCDEYSYVAVGGLAIKEIRQNEYKYLPMLIKEAHKRKAKIHGLGFTWFNLLPKYHFDSVDSTSWTVGNRFGYIAYFDGKTMKKIDAPTGHKLSDARLVALNNYMEWVKFQKYAEVHL